jgi:predicted Zn-dependent peptidase
MEQLVRGMCREDSFGLSRLGEIEDVEAITPEDLYAHYRSILRTAPMDIFYVGSAPKEQVAALLKSSFGDLQRACEALPAQTALRLSAEADTVHQMDVNQGKLCMGFVTDTTIRDEGFVAMQLLNMVFGGGMTSKLFMQIRERQSLCYAIGSGFHGSKGLMTVSAGIDSGMKEPVRQGVLEQLEACRKGEITQQELTAAKESLRSSLLATQDSPGALEGYYATAALSGLPLTPDAYIRAVEETTLEQVVAAANTLTAHTVFFLKGVQA